MLADLLIAGPALFFVGMGAYALLRPTRIVDRFGVAIETVDGRSEIRAVYGGFGLAVAGLLVWAVFDDGRGALWIPSVIAVLCFGMAMGRVVSLAADRTRGSAVVWQFLVVEIALAVSLFLSHVVR